MFGDGHQAQAIFIKQGLVDRDGRKLVEFRLRPTKNLMLHFGIDDRDLDPDTLSVVRRYPRWKVFFLNQDPTAGQVLVLCDFDGNETSMTRYYSELLEVIEGQEIEIKILRNHNARLQQEIEESTSQLQAYLNKVGNMLPKQQPQFPIMDTLQSNPDSNS